MRVARAIGWTVAAVLVVLASRSLAYAFAPHPGIVGGRLEQRLGGPHLVVLAIVAPLVALSLASAAVWLASVAVRERRLVEPAPANDVPPIRLVRVAAVAVGLGLATSAAFALLESYVHWRAGLGWHGLHCLVGPVHRDAIPFLWSLSLLATAVLAALEHLVGWMRRTIAAILGASGERPRGASVARPARSSAELVRPKLLAFGASPRGPPAALLAMT
jgi:hypothetical protein